MAAVTPGSALDAAANPNAASTSTDNEVTWDAPPPPDTTAPTVTVNQAAAQADPTSGSSILFDVVFSEPVTGFNAGDLAVTSSAGSLSADVQGGPAAYTVTLTGMSQTGSVTLAVVAGAAQDAATNPSTASTSTDASVQWNAPAQPDITPPTVTIDQGAAQADPTSASAVVFDVVFSEPVLGFATGDVTLGGTAGATSAVVSGSGATYTVTVTGMQQTGTVTASISAGVATDTSLNPNAASTSTDGSVQWNAPAQPDNTPPTVTIDQAAAQADPTSTSPVLFTVTFSEPVLGFATGDVTLGGTAGATAAAVSGGPSTYTVSVSGMTQSGTVTASIGAGKATDGAGNPNGASTSTDSAVQWNAPPPPDTTKPTVTIEQAAGQQDPAYGASVKFKVTFSEPVTGFGPEDVILGGTALPTGVTIATGSADDTVTITGGPSVYTVAVTGMTKKGTVTIAIAAGGVLDASGNPNDGSTAVDSTVTWRGVRPVPSVSVPPDGQPVGRPGPRPGTGTVAPGRAVAHRCDRAAGPAPRRRPMR